MWVSVGAPASPFTSNTNEYTSPGPPLVTGMPLVAFEHQKFAMLGLQAPPPLFPWISALQLPSPPALELMLWKVALDEPVNCTANELKVPEAVAPVVSTVIVTRNPPEPSEPLFVKVYTTPPALAVLSAFATPAKPKDANAMSAANTRTFFMKLPPGNCTHLIRGPVYQLDSEHVLYQRAAQDTSPLGDSCH